MILLLPPLEEQLGDALPQSSTAEDIPVAFEIGDLIVSFLDCLFDVTLIVLGRQFERDESTTLFLSFLVSSDLQVLHFLQPISRQLHNDMN